MSNNKPVVLVGLMGAGKSKIGRSLADLLGIDFVDSDREIEAAAGLTVDEIFQTHGEPAFRDAERKVIARLLDQGPAVIATGGGAFMDAETRALVSARAVSLWLRVPLDILLSRTARRDTRPLLKTGDPREILQRLMDQRGPVYALADIIVDCADDSVEETTARVANRLAAYQDRAQEEQAHHEQG